MKIKKFLILYILFSGIAMNIRAQTLPSPPWPITSDYGPRNVSNSWFHEGIDYGGSYGAGIRPVEGGIIKFTKYGGGWDIAVEGATGKWEYIHIFNGSNNALPVSSGNWELRNATLVKPDNDSDVKYEKAIILWTDKTKSTATKVLCSMPGRYVRTNGENNILGTNGQSIKTRSLVTSTEFIAPVGNSGGNNMATHLHLEVDDGDKNPLYYIKHSPNNLPTAEIESPPSKHIFNKEEVEKNYPVKVLVNSTGGLDLDKVNLMIYKNKDSSQKVFLAVRPTFGYGGRPGENRTSNITLSNGNNTGVMPIGGNPGQDKFVYSQKFGSLNLPDGEHFFVAKLTDVNGNVSGDFTRKIIIDASEPEITVNNSLGQIIPPDVGGTQDTYLCVSASDTATGLGKLEIYKDGELRFADTRYCGYLPGEEHKKGDIRLC